MSTTTLLLAAVVTMVAAAVQGVTGTGFGLVAAPALLLVAPRLVPGPLLALTVVVMALVVARDRAGLRPVDLAGALAGCLPGTAVGAALVVLVPARALEAAIGVAVVAGVAAALIGWRLPQSRGVLLGAGAVAGVMTSVAATPGPPMAVAYRPDDPVRLRANLSAFFAVGSLVSLGMLAAGGGLATTDLRDAAVLLPALAVGLLLGGPLARRASATAVRRGALLLSLTSGGVLLVRAALG